MTDFTYGCTWWWCAGSWAAGACTREFSSHGRQTWRRGLFSPCTLSPGNGQISPCCPVGKPEFIWATNKGGIHWSEVAEFQVYSSLSQHVLTLKLQNAMLQSTNKSNGKYFAWRWEQPEQYRKICPENHWSETVTNKSSGRRQVDSPVCASGSLHANSPCCHLGVVMHYVLAERTAIPNILSLWQSDF